MRHHTALQPSTLVFTATHFRSDGVNDYFLGITKIPFKKRRISRNIEYQENIIEFDRVSFNVIHVFKISGTQRSVRSCNGNKGHKTVKVKTSICTARDTHL